MYAPVVCGFCREPLEEDEECSYCAEVDQEELTARERELAEEYRLEQDYIENELGEYFAELQRELEDGWREDIWRQEADERARWDQEREFD